MNYPQPHEGVRGTERDDDLLSLAEKALPVRFALTALADHLHRATLVANPAPLVLDMYRRLTKPQVGDLVVEATARYRFDRNRQVKGFGILVAHRDEWLATDEDWAEMVKEERRYDPSYAEPRAVDHAWYVQYGPDPGDICRWTNCDFTVVPIEYDAFRDKVTPSPPSPPPGPEREPASP